MIRTIPSLMLALALALAPVAPVLAHDGAHDAQPVHESANPYEQGLKDARKAFEESYQRYRVAAQQAYWSWQHYQAYVRAYYEVYAAYSRYVWYQRAYEWYEKQGIRFAGRVLADACSGPAHVGHTDLTCPPGSPLAGATVQVTTYAPPNTRIAIRLLGTRTTDASGRFDFTGLPQGRVSWSVTKTGYAPRSGSVDLQHGTTRLDIRLKPSRGISGVVLARPLYGILPADPPAHFFEPRPLAGAKVTVYRTDVVYIQPYPGIVAPGPDRTAITGADGRFDFPDVDFASARVVIEKDSYNTHSENVELSRGPASLRVVMQYNGPPPPIAQPAGPSHDDINLR